MNRKLRTVIIEDELNAVDFMVSVIGEYCPELEVAGQAYNVKDGVALIGKEKPELVLLDIEMPDGTGFDLLEFFPEKNFDVVFITAFNHYAIRAIKFSAVDYILKPVNINEFIDSMKKVVKRRTESVPAGTENFKILLENLRTPAPSRLAIPTAEGMEYLNPREIIRIDADGSYSRFFLTGDRKILVSRNLKEFQDLLGDRNFFRSHNSCLVNLRFVKKFVRKDGGYIEMQDGSQAPVSRNRKDLFLIHMERFKG
jgi:two-component system, LytTR family, response regulator